MDRTHTLYNIQYMYMYICTCMYVHCTLYITVCANVHHLHVHVHVHCICVDFTVYAYSCTVHVHACIHVCLWTKVRQYSTWILRKAIEIVSFFEFSVYSPLFCTSSGSAITAGSSSSRSRGMMMAVDILCE